MYTFLQSRALRAAPLAPLAPREVDAVDLTSYDGDVRRGSYITVGILDQVLAPLDGQR